MNSDLLEQLKRFDTPTICNALEAIEPDRRNFGYTTRSMIAINEHAGPVCGLARTATCRSLHPSEKPSDQLKRERLEYYGYVHNGELPKVVVMQDLDGADAGRGPFWGEFNVRIHRALGCVAVITDGSFRDARNLPSDVLLLGAGLRPSHANIHIIGFAGQVNVHGMAVSDSMIVHADEHGAVSFPSIMADKVVEEARLFIESERPIIEACKSDSLSFERLRELYLGRGAK